jgi:hypothetical protein
MVSAGAKDRDTMRLAYDLMNPDEKIREKAIISLERQSTPEALAILMRMLSFTPQRLIIPRYQELGNSRAHGHLIFSNFKDHLTGETFEFMTYPRCNLDLEETVDLGENPEYVLMVKSIEEIKSKLSENEKVQLSELDLGAIKKSIVRLKNCLDTTKEASKQLYGTKALRLAYMIQKGMPVPDGFVIRSEADDEEIAYSIDNIISETEKQTGKKLGDKNNSLRLAVRSSPSQSMPGLLLTELGISTKEDLISAIKRVRNSWDSTSAETYRKKKNIREEGTAVIIQPMIYGDKNDNSASGVLFTRDVMTGKNKLTGRFAIKRKGEDIVARKDIQTQSMDELNKKFPEVYSELAKIKGILETEFKNVQDVEFVIEDKKLWLLQDRDAVLSPQAQAKVAVDMANERLITQFAMLNKIIEAQDEQLEKKLYRIRKDAKVEVIGKGTPSSPGAIQGPIAFNTDKAMEFKAQAKIPILIAFKRTEEIRNAILNGGIGIVTQYGHDALHESILARTQGIPLVDAIEGVRFKDNAIMIGGYRLEEGSEMIMDGSKGEIYIPKEDNVLEEDRTVSILGTDFDYSVKEDAMRTKYSSSNYEELLSEHAKLITLLKELKEEVTLQDMYDNLTAHVIHQLIIEKGEKLGKTSLQVDVDIDICDSDASLKEIKIDDKKTETVLGKKTERNQMASKNRKQKVIMNLLKDLKNAQRYWSYKVKELEKIGTQDALEALEECLHYIPAYEKDFGRLKPGWKYERRYYHGHYDEIDVYWNESKGIRAEIWNENKTRAHVDKYKSIGVEKIYEMIEVPNRKYESIREAILRLKKKLKSNTRSIDKTRPTSEAKAEDKKAKSFASAEKEFTEIQKLATDAKISTLINSCVYGDSYIREDAIINLARIGLPAIDALFTAAINGDEKNRENLISVLKDIATDNSNLHLKDEVRNAAALAVEKITKIEICGFIAEPDTKSKIEGIIQKAIGEKRIKEFAYLSGEEQSAITADQELLTLFKDRNVQIIDFQYTQNTRAPPPWVLYESPSRFVIAAVGINKVYIAKGLLDILLEKDVALLKAILKYRSEKYSDKIEDNEKIYVLQAEYLTEEVYLIYSDSIGKLQESVFEFLKSVVKDKFGLYSDKYKKKNLSKIIEEAKEKSTVEGADRLEDLLKQKTQRESLSELGTNLEAIKGQLTSDKAKYKDDIVFLPPGSKIYVIGDTHGDSDSTQYVLDEILKKAALGKKVFIVFLGDYVNNGLDSIGNLTKVLKLKGKYPNNVILLNGNHEFRETYLTALKEYFKTHWGNANTTRKSYPAKIPEEETHYGHIRLELITKYGVEKGEELYKLFEEWGRSLPYICFAADGIMMSHSIGLKKDTKEITFKDLANVKEEDAKVIKELGYEAWKKAQVTLHAAMVNNRKITPGLLDMFKKLGVNKGFVVGHTHYRSGDIDHDESLVTICSSDMNSPNAGHYMYQEMVVEAKEGGSRNREGRPGNASPYYLEIDLSSQKDIDFRPVQVPRNLPKYTSPTNNVSMRLNSSL